MSRYAKYIVPVSSIPFSFYLFDSRSYFHTAITMPILRLFDPEISHDISVKLIELGIYPRFRNEQQGNYKLFGKSISSPVGIAAGYDKNGRIIDGLFNMGFSLVEIGSVCLEPQQGIIIFKLNIGNAKPRVFRIPEGIINRYGFNSEGSDVVKGILVLRKRTKEYKSGRNGCLLGINLGKNKSSTSADYPKLIRKFAPFADYLVVNISSPNTPGLRTLQTEGLDELVRDCVKARDEYTKESRDNVPLVFKVAPDLRDEDIEYISSVLIKYKIDGVIIGNTTIQRPSLDSMKGYENYYETGGMSGKLLKDITLQVVKKFKRKLPEDFIIIGCGGIRSKSDMEEYMKYCNAIQVYSGLVYQGPRLVTELRE